MILGGNTDVAEAGELVMPERAANRREVELKLEIDPADIALLVRHPFVCDRLGPAVQHESVYYDTSKGRLRNAGLSLRVRRTGDRFLQTVKATPGAAAGLYDRSEWEIPIDGPQPCLDHASAVSPAFAEHANRRGLRPVFATRIERRACMIESEGGCIELVIDRGEVVAGEHSLPIAEIELELVRGSPEALFRLARELQRIVPLRLGVATKAERGARVVAGHQHKATKAEPLLLSEDMCATDAFKTIAFGCLRHFRTNEPLVLQDRDADALHQCRVALRRLRSALSLFKPVLRGPEFERFRSDLRALSATLGTSRNLDVLIRRRSEDLSRESRERLVVERERSYEKAVDMLQSPVMREMMIDLTEWIAIGIDGARPALFASASKARPFAQEVLDRFWKRVKKRGRNLRHLDEDDRHEFRIAGKKLRYAGEFFAALYGGQESSARRDAFLQALTALQDALGDLNDLATERQLRHMLAKLDIVIPRRSRSREAGFHDAHLADAEKAFVSLLATGPFWRGEKNHQPRGAQAEIVG